MSQSNIDLNILPPQEEPKAEDILLGLSEIETASTSLPSTEQEREEDYSADDLESKDEAEKKSRKQKLKDWVADDDEESLSFSSWRQVFAGAGLVHALRNNWKFFTLIIIFTIVYVGLGYLSSDALIENDRLSKELLDRRYKALTCSSELRERTLRSKVEELLTDTTLQTTTDRPFQLLVDREP